MAKTPRYQGSSRRAASQRLQQPAGEQVDAKLVEQFEKALQGTDEIQLTVTGRVSDRKISQPVWFVQEDGILYLLPVKGSDTEWFKNVLKNPTITLSAGRVGLSRKATPLTNPAKVRGVVEKFRGKYDTGDVSKYYSKFDVAVAVPLTPDAVI
jgi:hypothetical protein